MPALLKGPLLTERSARRWGWAIITVLVLVVHWPLSTFTCAMGGGDAFDCWLPWRHFMTLALQNGELPLWNPLQQMGYPVHADLQGPMWYPEAIAIGGTIGHSVITLQVLYLFYVIIGGVGLMRLCNTVHGDARVGVIAGIAYALSGNMVAHQMHFYAIISAAWMPWFLAAQLRLLRAPAWRRSLEAALFLMLLLTGGNHTFTIMSAYLLLPLLLLHAMRAWHHGRARALRQLLGHQALFVGSTLVMACGTFHALIEVSPYLGRMHGLPYLLVSQEPFTVEALSSLLAPVVISGKNPDLGTDPAMANGYMGVIILALALVSVLRHRSAEENVFAVFGLGCALLSMAADLPFHRWVWRWLPGLDVFRFPSYYLYFTLVATVLLAAGAVKPDARWRPGLQRPLVYALCGALVLGTLIVLLWPDRFPEAAADAPRRSALEYVRALGHNQRLWHAWAVTAVVLLVGLALGLRRRLTPGVVLALVVVEMGWNTHLAIWNSATTDLHPAALQARLDQLPQGPVAPDLLPLLTHRDSGERLHHLWRNTQTLIGRPTRDGFNSFWPAHTDSLINFHPALVRSMDRWPFIHLTDRLAPDKLLGHEPADSTAVFVPRLVEGLQCSSNDRVAFNSWDYNGFTLRCTTAAPTFMLVQQSWFPGWTIRIDGVPVEVVRANVAAFGCVLPGGDHVVEVCYEKPWAPWLMALSMVSFFAVLFVLAFALRGSARTLALLGSASLMGLVAWSLLVHRPGYDDALRQHRLAERCAPSPSDLEHFKLAGTPLVLAQPEHLYTPAYRTSSDSLLDMDHRALMVDLAFRPHGRCSGKLILQRSYRGRTTDYEAVPFISPDSSCTRPCTFTLVRDLRELRYRGEELSIYAWNLGTDTITITDLQVRTSPRAVWEE